MNPRLRPPPDYHDFYQGRFPSGPPPPIFHPPVVCPPQSSPPSVLYPPWGHTPQPFRPPLPTTPEERYEPMTVTHQPVDLPSSAFCSSCRCPMEIKIRLDPCYHLVCLDCFPSIKSRNHLCIACNTECTLAMPLHPNDVTFTCSGTCTANHQGKAFLNSRSLKCHEMLFHSEEDDALQVNSQSSTSSERPCQVTGLQIVTTTEPVVSAHQYKELEPHIESLRVRQTAVSRPESEVPSMLGSEGLGGVLGQQNGANELEDFL